MTDRPGAGRRHTGRDEPGSRPSWRDDRVWQVGVLVGSALGAAATVAGRHAERNARAGGLVDWPEVERIAISRLRSARGTLPPSELAAAEPAYADAMGRIVPALSAALGSPLPGVVERSGVVDRATWVRANTGSFRSLIGKLEADLLDQVIPPGGGLAKATMALANRWVTTRQLGFLLGFMGTRVLGQYDLALLSTEIAPGRLLFVEENIRATARALDVPLGPFRTWIALHETTHAFEFEAHPWLRPYLAERLERQLTLFGKDASGMGREVVKGLGRTLRGEGGGEHWIERMMGPEQKAIFRETQAVMSLLEGFSDYVMDEVGRDLVPGVERISERFHERRNKRTPFERTMLRLTGMDLKIEQYKKGERFVRAIADARGPAALTALWTGPETLPRDGEIEAPQRWIARVLDGTAAPGSTA
ncbi:MAG: zinc-dependent metalloprotease [Chloroflexota bacterium]